MVYAWVSVRSGKCYVGSTKENILDRAKTHLKIVRRIREEWKKTGGERRIEDQEAMNIHYEIARKPGEWVIVPLTGEVVDWKRVEKKLIKWFGGDMNVIGKKKESEKKRKRPYKKEREKNKKEKTQEKTEDEHKTKKDEKKENKKEKRKNKLAITEYKINKIVYQDIWNAIKERTGKIKIEWKNGMVDATRWEKIWSEKIIIRAEEEEKEIEGWKEIKKVIKKKE